MNEVAGKIKRALFSEKSRRFLTFGWMTLFVAILAIWNMAMLFVLKQIPQPPPLVGSAVFLIPYNTAVFSGFVVIYLTRKKAHYYAARAVFYGMLLAAVAGELLCFGQLHWHTLSK